MFQDGRLCKRIIYAEEVVLRVARQAGRVVHPDAVRHTEDTQKGMKQV